MIKERKSTRCLLAIDPGKNSSAFCCVVGSEIKKLGMFNHTINNLKPGYFHNNFHKFYIEFTKLIASLESKYGKLTNIVMERFMARPGKGGGAVSESINIMIGVIATYCHDHGIAIELITSASWKNRYKRKFGMDTQAARFGFPWVAKAPLSKNPYPINDHIMDACGIALYCLETMPDLGSGTTKKQDLDFFPTFKKQLRVIWDRIAAKTNYDEQKDHEREKKAKARTAAKGAESRGPEKTSKAKTNKRKTS